MEEHLSTSLPNKGGCTGVYLGVPLILPKALLERESIVPLPVREAPVKERAQLSGGFPVLDYADYQFVQRVVLVSCGTHPRQDL